MALFQNEFKCGNDFDLHENKTAFTTYFHMKGFALRLVLKQRHSRLGNDLFFCLLAAVIILVLEA